jgi:hypothetical protein
MARRNKQTLPRTLYGATADAKRMIKNCCSQGWDAGLSWRAVRERSVVKSRMWENRPLGFVRRARRTTGVPAAITKARLIWQKKGPKFPLHPVGTCLCSPLARIPHERLFIEAEKRTLTRNLTFNLRCRRNVWSVRQWSFRGATSLRPGSLLIRNRIY